MKHKLNRHLFARFFWNVATEQEADHVFRSQEAEDMLWQQWLQADQPPHQAAHQTSEAPDRALGFAKLRQQIDGPTMQRPAAPQRFYLQWTRYAAMLALSALVGGLYFYYGVYKTRNELVWVEKHTGRGERISLVLPDSSIVWLNSASSLRYPARFGADERRVELRGEAFFEVRKAPDQPFRVACSPITVEVLGTRFNLRARPEEPLISTTLVQGRVRVEKKQDAQGLAQSAVLHPNMQAVYDTRTKHMLLDQVQVNDYVLWHKGRLVLRQKPLDEVAAELERWFDIEIELGPMSRRPVYTLTVTDENLEHVLERINRTTPNLKIEKHERKFYIRE